MQLRTNTSGFTLIELIVGMTIFAIGLTGIFALLHSTMGTVQYSRDEIVVSGLLREQVDLVMNMRDTNLRNYIPWDSVYVENNLTQTGFASGVYLIENNYTSGSIQINPSNGKIDQSPVKLIKVDPFPTTDEAIWGATRLWLDAQGRYTHATTGTGTQFASYIRVSPLALSGAEIKKDGKNQGWIIDARVLVKSQSRYREYDAKTMITDWQK